MYTQQYNHYLLLKLPSSSLLSSPLPSPSHPSSSPISPLSLSLPSLPIPPFPPSHPLLTLPSFPHPPTSHPFLSLPSLPPSLPSILFSSHHLLAIFIQVIITERTVSKVSAQSNTNTSIAVVSMQVCSNVWVSTCQLIPSKSIPL